MKVSQEKIFRSLITEIADKTRPTEKSGLLGLEFKRYHVSLLIKLKRITLMTSLSTVRSPKTLIRKALRYSIYLRNFTHRKLTAGNSKGTGVKPTTNLSLIQL